jgi:hypothetical protein
MKGENEEQNERTHIQAKKQKHLPSGQVRRMGKNHVPNPFVTRSMLEKERVENNGMLTKYFSIEFLE